MGLLIKRFVFHIVDIGLIGFPGPNQNTGKKGHKNYQGEDQVSILNPCHAGYVLLKHMFFIIPGIQQAKLRGLSMFYLLAVLLSLISVPKRCRYAIRAMISLSESTG